MVLKMPDSIRCSISVFVISDETGVESKIAVGEGTQIDGAKFSDFISAAIYALNEAIDVKDARAMTADEVADYLKRQREDEIAARCAHSDIEE